MDKTDITLCQLLQAYSRTPYHELANRLGLSTNAVHKRIKELKEEGIIRSFRARLSLEVVGGKNVWVFGRSDSSNLDEVHLSLRKNDSTYWVAVSGGGFLYVGGYIRGNSRIEPYVSFVKRHGEIPDPRTGILPSSPKPPMMKDLRQLDYQIIAALHDDARRPLSSVAKQIGASTKTVRRRLERMVERRTIELTIDWYPDASNDIIAISHIEVADSADWKKVSSFMIENLSPHVLFCVPLSNLPTQVIAFLWTNTMRQMQELRERIRRIESVRSENLNVLQIGYIFNTWRDTLTIGKGRGATTR